MLRNFYLGPRFYAVLGGLVLLQILSNFFATFGLAAQLALLALLLALVSDILILFRLPAGLLARREAPARLSNGDDNSIRLFLNNRYPFALQALVIDELPVQLQIRDFAYHLAISPGQEKVLEYTVRPLRRGEYHFGNLNVFIASPLGLVRRRYRFPLAQMVPVYPSFVQMRKYELLAISNRLSEAGVKKIRRVGHTMEFEQIREYVSGDDYRTINWKATARRHNFMVNHYQDERSQQVYSVINMGRVMKMPFQGMSLLDYAINASLVISNIAIRKQDKAGLITFSHKIGSILPADRKPLQMHKILEVLYRQESDFLESNYELLFSTLLQKLKQRSLVLLFSNFETLNALKRQLPSLRRIAGRHVLVVIFFENTELRTLLETPAAATEAIYHQTIAAHFAYEKKQIVKELQRYGIYSILSAPEQLSVNTINKYLYLKARGFI